MTRGMWGCVFAWLLAVPAFAQNADLFLRVEGPEVELTTGSEFGATVLLDSQIDGVQGWSFAVENDPGAVEFLGAELGSTTATVNDGRTPDFLVVNQEPAGGQGVTMAAVINFTQPISLGAGKRYELLTMSYRVVADPTQADPCKPIETTIGFSDVLGDPPVQNALTVEGATEFPIFGDLSVTVRCPGNIEFTRCDGDTENVHLEWTFGGVPTWDFLFLFRDGDLLAMLELDATAFDDLGLAPADYAYTLATIVVKDPFNPTLIFASCVATVIPLTVESVDPAIGYWIGGDVVTIRGQAFTSVEMTTITFTAPDEEPLALVVQEVISENEMTAITPRSPRLGRYDIRVENERGFAELANAFEYGFIRGETNADGVVDISDPIQVLAFLFLGEGAPPLCLDAADATDDGRLDVSDAIRVLAFLFLGAQPPAEPFPDPGQDPTTRDPFGCLEALDG